MIRLSLLLAALLAGAAHAVPVQRIEVAGRVPHDTGAFTEGLLFHDGRLFESTGLEGASSIREVRPADGRVLRRRDLPASVFGEGLVVAGGRIVTVEWQSGRGTLWSIDGFRPLGSFRYRPEGWGLTSDGRRIVMSDGTARLRFLDPKTLRQTGSVKVTVDGRPLAMLNELEWIDGEVWANIWQTDMIARIDPASGRVKALVDLAGLLPEAERIPGQTDVLNGIAYDARTRAIWVTGKNWPWMYRIRVMHPGR